jgi:hypothetical protein
MSFHPVNAAGINMRFRVAGTAGSAIRATAGIRIFEFNPNVLILVFFQIMNDFTLHRSASGLILIGGLLSQEHFPRPFSILSLDFILS